MKNWLVHHKKKIELASKRSWKNYWVCLKGTMLLFYTCDSDEPSGHETKPRHMLGTLPANVTTTDVTELP